MGGAWTWHICLDSIFILELNTWTLYPQDYTLTRVIQQCSCQGFGHWTLTRFLITDRVKSEFWALEVNQNSCSLTYVKSEFLYTGSILRFDHRKLNIFLRSPYIFNIHIISTSVWLLIFFTLNWSNWWWHSICSLLKGDTLITA